jgi:signal transduction histidine kinase/ligand-binding sensor domain-containing protein
MNGAPEWRLWCAAALAAAAWSVPAVAWAGGYLIDVRDSESGLPSSTVTSIAQTSEGYLWIGTHNGLVRFDGMRLTTFDPETTPELTHARVESLFVDSNGALWINTYDGSLTSWRAGAFTHEWTGKRGPDFGAWLVSSRDGRPVFVLETGELIRRELEAADRGRWRVLRAPGATLVSVFCEDRSGVVWIRSLDHRLWRLVGDRLEPVEWRAGLDGRSINHIASGPDGRLWIGTDREIAVFENGRFKKMNPEGGERSLNVNLILCTRDGGLWIVANGRARKAVGGKWVLAPDACRDLTGTFRTSVNGFEDRQGGVWFTHLGKGLIHVSRDGEARKITMAEGLPGERVSSFLEDREGNVWVGVDRGGLARLRVRRFQVLGSTEGLSAKGAVSICEDGRGVVWIGTLGGGLDRWWKGALANVPFPSATAGGFVFSVYPDRTGRLWMSGDREDLFLFDKNAIRRAGVSVHGIKAILVDRVGRVWLGRKDGLSVLEEGRLKSFGPEDGFERTDVRALAEDRDGNVWIGSGDGAVYRFQDGTLAVFRTADSAQQAVWSLLPDDDGSVWAGTFRGGLLRLKDGRFTRYTTRDGLLSDVVCQLLDDGQGRLWVGSHQGIFRVPKAALRAFAAGEVRTLPCVGYGRSDGLPTLECSGNYQPACWRGRDGRLWFATTKGVVSVQPREITENNQPPPVVIEDVLVDDRSASPRAGAGTPNGAPAVPVVEIAPDSERVELRYAGLSLTAPEKVRFRYRLEPLEREWVEASFRRFAQYSYLRPGTYRFSVLASNSEGIWNEAGAGLTLKVLPHVWETWWFLSALALVATGAVAAAARHLATRRLKGALERLERQRAVERDRARIAKDIHDDLGAGLTQITLLSELARSDSPQETDQHLAQISETARELTRGMDEIVWAVNPRNDTLDSLTTYVCRFAQEYLNVAGIQCRLDVPAQLPALPVTSEVRHNLFLAIKEALNNVIKHARAREVRLRLQPGADGFTLVIEDDGQGFDVAGATSAGAAATRLSPGQGLENLGKRLEAIGGSCVVTSEPGRGTRIEMTVSLA